MQGRVLVVAGSDSGGGAGIQADVKTITMLGAFATTAITALTAQNTRGVFGVVPVAPAFVTDQIRVVVDDIGTDAVKTGMIPDAATITAFVQATALLAVPFVIDPVMVAKGGARLLDHDALAVMRALLVPRATVLTPNAPEAAVLTDLPVDDADDVPAAAERLLAMGAKYVLMKGGHLPGDEVVDALFGPEGVVTFRAPRQDTTSTHGTGCTLASAVAAGLAQGLDVEAAVRRAHAYVARAIATAPGFGGGHGPLNHAHPLDR